MGFRDGSASTALAFHGGIVEPHDFALDDPRADPLRDRLEVEQPRQRPVAHRLTRKREARARENRLLAVQRQVVLVFVDQDLRQQAGADARVFDRARYGGRRHRLDLAIAGIFLGKLVERVVVHFEHQLCGAVLDAYFDALADLDLRLAGERADALFGRGLMAHVLARKQVVGNLSRRVLAAMTRADLVVRALAIRRLVHERRSRQRLRRLEGHRLLTGRVLTHGATRRESFLQSIFERATIFRGALELFDQQSVLALEHTDALLVLEHMTAPLALGEHALELARFGLFALRHVHEATDAARLRYVRRKHEVSRDSCGFRRSRQLAARLHFLRSRSSRASIPLMSKSNSS